ncbi:uncharacterized protein [Lepeophtheirus salmonis]|uniref:uncharacterized protein isoform X3 n=1 Tax=Lepeophtheirus salmonis TaxID=72036 RepID=UPI001AE197CD|nr:uncharacterized protein LOC121115115 isoform X3 [Lepeophtheirus salmonis]
MNKANSCIVRILELVSNPLALSMDCSVELERSCTLLSDSLKKFHEHLHLDLKPSDEEPNILHEVCKKSKDMVQKDLVILGAQSLSFNYWSQRIVGSLLPNDSTLKYSICPLDKMWQNVESIELIAHSFAYIIILNKELLFWLSSHPNVTIGRIIRSPNKTIGLFIGDGKYLNKCHREQLIHFHRWNRVIDANLDCPNTTDRLIKITLERVLSYSNVSGSSFKVISPDEFVSWKRNRLLILIQGLELDINSRVELEIDKGASSVQTFSRYSGQVLEFNMPPICHPTSIELIVDGNSLGRACIKVRDPNSELVLLNSYLNPREASVTQSLGYITLSEAQTSSSSKMRNAYYSVPKSNYDRPPSRIRPITNTIDMYKF